MKQPIATRLITPVPGDTTFPVKVSVFPDGVCLLSQDRMGDPRGLNVLQVHPNRIPDLIEALEATFEAWANRPLYRDPSDTTRGDW